MRILFLNPIGTLGGGERVLLDLLAELPRVMPGVARGLLVGRDGPLAEKTRAMGVETHEVRMPDLLAGVGTEAMRANLAGTLARAGVQVPGYVLALARAVRTFAPDLVHSNGVKTHLLGALAVPRRVPLIWHVHDFLGERGKLAWVLKATAWRVTRAIANAHAVAEDARPILGRVPIDVVHNAVDTSLFSPAAVDGALLDVAAGRAPAPEGTLRIGLVATYARWKGHEAVLEATARLRQRGVAKVRVYLIGGPVYATSGSQYAREELEARARALGIEDAVAFVPFLEDPVRAFRALDVVVHASTRPEPFGRTIIEGMACAKPVVVSAAGGAAELFREGVDALGFAPGDVAALADVLGRLIEDAPLRTQLGARARQTVLARFGRERFGDEIAGVYARTIRLGAVV